MEPAKLRQQILLSNKTASEKAEHLLLKREVNEMSKDEWRELIAGIPDNVEREIGRLKSAGTQLHLHVCLIVQGQQLALQHHLVSQWRCLILQLVAWQAHCIFWCIACSYFFGALIGFCCLLNASQLLAFRYICAAHMLSG